MCLLDMTVLPDERLATAVRMWARMRDADVGAAGVRVGGRQFGGAGVDEGRRGGGLTGGQARGQQRADDAGQHVARSPRSPPRTARPG